jgi:Protein of unknown function (DUF3455)/Protein of unknown function (DUF2990)
MRSTHLVIASLASIALAAPSPTVSERGFFSWSAPLARFYQEVDREIQQARQSPNYPNPPPCDMSKASMPIAPTPLPSPAAETYLRHVAIGRGVQVRSFSFHSAVHHSTTDQAQNYTCTDSSPSSTPSPIGAVASLYNASCTECNYPSLTTMITNLVVNYPLPSNPTANFQPTNILLSGHHFFSNNTTPVFDLDLTPQAQYGYAIAKKQSASPAPSDAPVGPNGEAAVAWLKLDTVDGTKGGLKHIYRVNTVGGSAPKTCEGMEAGDFSVEYSAQYWVYAADGS